MTIVSDKPDVSADAATGEALAIPLVHSGLIADGPGNVRPVVAESSLDSRFEDPNRRHRHRSLS